MKITTLALALTLLVPAAPILHAQARSSWRAATPAELKELLFGCHVCHRAASNWDRVGPESFSRAALVKSSGALLWPATIIARCLWSLRRSW